MSVAIASLQKVVAAAATAEPLSATSLLVRGFQIRALLGNTNQIYVGNSAVAAANGYELDAGEVASYEDLAGRDAVDEVDLNLVYIDADTNGEGVSVLYVR